MLKTRLEHCSDRITGLDTSSFHVGFFFFDPILLPHAFTQKFFHMHSIKTTQATF